MGEDRGAINSKMVSCGFRKVAIPTYKAIAVVAMPKAAPTAKTMVATFRTEATRATMQRIRWECIDNECNCTHLLAGGLASGGFAGGLLGSGHGDGVLRKLVFFVRELFAMATMAKLWQWRQLRRAPALRRRRIQRNTTSLRRK